MSILKNSSEIKTIAKNVGAFIEYWGFKSIHGKIWTYLFLSSKPLTATELTKLTGVSKALVSISLKDLLKYGVVRKVNRSRKNQYFETTNYLLSIQNVLRSRERTLINQAKASVKSALKSSDLDEESHNRLRELEKMILMADQFLEKFTQMPFVHLDLISQSFKKLPKVFHFPSKLMGFK